MSALPPLRIAKPCSADWSRMTGDDRVRHCSLCNLNVYNLSAMSEPEVLKLLQEREGRLCVRMYQRADGTVITQDCPVGVRAAWRRMTRFATAVLAMIFVAPFARAQRVPIQPPEPIVQVETAKGFVEIRVVNRLGEPTRAEVELQDKAFNVLQRVETDRHGHARLKKPEEGTYILVVRAPLLLTYSRVLAFDETSVTVEADIVTMGTMGELVTIDPVDSQRYTPMPLRGIPDYRRSGPNSVR